MNEVIRKAIKITGSQKKLGDACGVAQQSVFKWLHNKTKVSPEFVPLIVKATKGEIKDYEIRPDIPHLFKHPRSAS